MADIKAALTAMLSETRDGVELPAGFIRVVVDFLVDVALVSDVKQVQQNDLKDTFAEAWSNHSGGPEMPTVISRPIKRWLRGDSSVDSAKPRSMDGEVAELMDDCDESVIFGSEPSMKDIRDLEEDKRAQGLSGTRLLKLSCAFELGRVPGNGEVLGGITYKSDPRLSKLSKDQKKAGMRTLSKLLECKDSGVRRELQQHFGGIIREYTEL